MQLKPSEPPGSDQRKLRRFTREISRLRTEGYTIRAIRQALADAGVEVGWSTVRRELARLEAAEPVLTIGTVEPKRSPPKAASSSPTPVLQPSPPAPIATLQEDTRKHPTQAEIDKFFETVNTNPLFRKKGLKP